MIYKIKIILLPILILVTLTTLANAREYPLRDAAGRGDIDTVKMLLDKGYDVNTSDRNGYTALHLAASSGKTEIVKLLLSKGAFVDAKQFAGYTPLIEAAFGGHRETVKALIEGGANTDMAIARLESYPSHYSDAYKAKAAIKLIEKVIPKEATIATTQSISKEDLKTILKAAVEEAAKGHREDLQNTSAVASDTIKSNVSPHDSIEDLPTRLNTTQEKRTALVIGNSMYSSGPLRSPVNDATDMANALKRLGFKVNLKKNANLETMEGAIEDFGNELKRGGVGLFYYAGHGVQVNGTNYLLPIGAKINKESDVKYQAVDANKILDEMANTNNGLNIVMLDACRDNPFARSFRNATRGLAVVSSAPSGTFISYSTSPGNVARDGDGRNSPYTAALLKYIGEPGLSINEVFIKVRQNVRKSTGQTPWELSSLEGNFYFNQGQAVKIAEKKSATAGKDEVKEESSADLETEQQKIAAQREKLKQERELVEQRKALAEEQQKLEEEKKKLAMAQRPSVSAVKEIRRDGRFIAYDNGTVLDTKTNLMWAANDNGKEINWKDAKSYCESYRGGGYTDWRMPTQDELAGLYDSSITQINESNPRKPLHLTELIKATSCCPWANYIRGSEAASFNLIFGTRIWDDHSHQFSIIIHRALPVRFVK